MDEDSVRELKRMARFSGGDPGEGLGWRGSALECGDEQLADVDCDQNEQSDEFDLSIFFIRSGPLPGLFQTSLRVFLPMPDKKCDIVRWSFRLSNVYDTRRK